MLLRLTLMLTLTLTTAYASKPTDYSIKSANYIAQVQKRLKSGYLSISLVKNALAHIKKDPVFKAYIPSLTETIRIKKKYSKKLFFTCHDQTIIKNSVHRKFIRSVKNYCYKLFSKNISNKFYKNLMKNNDFLRKVIKNSLLSKDSTLIKSLKQLDVTDKLYTHIRSELIDVSLEEGISPQNAFYDHIDFNKDLTFLIQKNIHSLRRNKLIFTNEFLKIYKDFKSQYHKHNKVAFKESASQLLAFYDQNKDFIYYNTAWKRLLFTAQKLNRADQLDSSKEILSYLINSSKKDSHINQAIFEYLWVTISRKKYSETIADIEKLKLIYKFSTLSSKVKFWIALSLKREGSDSISNHLFGLLIRKNPLNYYSIISQGFVDSFNSERIKKKFTRKNNLKTLLKDKDFSAPQQLNIIELFTWKSLGYTRNVDRLIRDFVHAQPKDLISNREILSDYDNEEVSVFIHNYFIKLFKENDDFLSSFKFISRSLDKENINTDLLNIEHLFPTKYLSKIKDANSQIDPYLILSIIRQESAFNPDAMSHVGARGLMQLMPSTARSLVKFKSKKQLLNPDLNIKAGVKYFEKLLKRFDGNLVLALSSYNAGPTKVSKWVQNRFKHTDPIHLIEEIPYKETRMYVKLIYRNLFFYNLLNNNYLLDKSIKKTFKVSSTKR